MDKHDTTQEHLTETILDSTRGELGNKGKTLLEPCLVILSGADYGRSFQLNRTRNSFGRGQDVDIVFTDPKMSRSHGAVVIDDDRVEVIDFRSTNGTFLNGERIERAYVPPNARIRAGGTEMKIEFKRAAEIEAERRLYQAANTDPLTGALNRRAFFAQTKQEIANAIRSDKGLSILMCDIDHFKQINDGHGHPAGDYVLKELVSILRAHIRNDDLLARFGGEEFVLLLRKTDAATAYDWGERIRAAIEQHNFMFDGRQIPVTLSIGVKSTHDLDASMLDEMIRHADAALYQAKHSGRNRVSKADITGDEG